MNPSRPQADPPPPTDPTVVFTTHSDVEASVVRALLDSHDIRAVIASDVTHAVLPLTVDGRGKVRVVVASSDADEARRVIEESRDAAGQRFAASSVEYEALERAIEYRFRDRGVLEHALTHRSRAHEDLTGGEADNESLEFLGDAVLGFIIADMLFRELPESDEGEKSKLKASLVSTSSLAGLSSALQLGDYLLLGRGEAMSGGRSKQALLADVYEALIAAIYVDGGVEAARAFVLRQFDGFVRALRAGHRPSALARDDKSALQEWVQSRDLPLPEYHVTRESGPDHRKVFHVEVIVEGSAIAQAEGRSKKEAEQRAAAQAIERLMNAGTNDSRKTTSD